LGETLVLPWAVALGTRPNLGPSDVIEHPIAALAELRHRAEALAAAAWETAPQTALGRAKALFRELRAGDPAAALDLIRQLRPIDPTDASRVLALASGIGRRLESRGLVPDPETMWRLTETELKRAIVDGIAPPIRLGPDRWEPFVFELVAAAGLPSSGAPASPGIGAGRLRVLTGSPGEPRPGPREVLVVGEPVPQVAPLLWRAAALITRSGSVGAHLFEVARSLGVPAVIGVEPPIPDTQTLAAVDGATGDVAFLSRPEGGALEPRGI
jgi:phosphohistidine swiveling domain-containing protein